LGQPGTNKCTLRDFMTMKIRNRMKIASVFLLAGVLSGRLTMLSAEEVRVSSYKVGNRHIVRTIDIKNGCLSTKAIGRPSRPISVIGGDEFALILGPDKKRITAGEFKISSVEPAADELKIIMQHPDTGLKAEVEYRLKKDDFYLRKTINLKNEGTLPVQVLDVEVESLRFGNARALGLGKPVYAEGKLFLGLEFPLSHNEQQNGLVKLRQLLGKTLQPGESLVTKTAVAGAASKKETVEEAFDRYIRRIALRKPEVMTVYGNWARYDYLSDDVWPDEKMVLETVDELIKMREAGWQADYYVMDAGWFDRKGDYTDYVKPAWPNGPEPMATAINNIGIKYGLWFEVGGGILDNPAVQPSRNSSGRLCLASEPYISTFKKALIEQIKDLGLTMVKFDFATFNCDSDQHGHILGEYATEASLASFLEMLDSVRREHPEVKYIIFNGFHRSPWWLMHVDTIYCGDPAPSDVPSLKLRDSINLKTDNGVHEHRVGHFLPWYAIDDCGLMIGKTGTIYWIGAEEFRKTWVLNIGRGGMMPFIYGDLRLLDDSDRRFITKIWDILLKNAKVFANTKVILGRPNGKEVYGYSHFMGQHGFVFLSNPTFEQKAVTLKLDTSLGLNASSKSPLAVSEIFPVECNYTDDTGFKSGGEINIELAPFEVRALEIRPSKGKTAKAVPPRKSIVRSTAIPAQIIKKDAAWVNDGMVDLANKELAHLFSSTSIKAEKPDNFTLSGMEAAKGVYSFTVEMPTFDKPQTLAIPIRFMAGGKPVRSTSPTKCVLAAARSDGRQIMLDVTPEYGSKIWSGCSWLTFHAKLDLSLSGKKIEVLALNLGLDGAGLEMGEAYLLENDACRITANTGHCAAAGAQSEPVKAVQGIVERWFPEHRNDFVFIQIPKDPGGDVFEIESNEGRIFVRGNDGVAMASGLNWYLKYYCNVNITYFACQTRLPKTLPEVPAKIRQVSPYKYRYIFNYCAFSYLYCLTSFSFFNS